MHHNAFALCLAIIFGCLTSGCSNAYSALKKTAAPADCLQQFKPQFVRTLYNTQVNVLDHHLSGILLVKQMPDSSTRLLFTMETGFKFFDFEFSKTGEFKVYYIFDKMNKKAVIKTLRKDFELVLMQEVGQQQPETFSKDGLYYNLYRRHGDYNYYVTDTSCTHLMRIEKSSKRKLNTIIVMQDYKNGVPDTIGISQQNINFTIGLKKLEPVKE